MVVVLDVVVVVAVTVDGGRGARSFVFAAVVVPSSPTTTAREKNVRRSGITQVHHHNIHAYTHIHSIEAKFIFFFF